MKLHQDIKNQLHKAKANSKLNLLELFETQQFPEF